MAISGRPLVKSLVVAALTTAGALAIAAPGAYAIARLPAAPPLRDRRGLLVTRMFPEFAVGVSVATRFAQLGLVDSYLGLVLAHLTGVLPFIAWLLVGAFEGVPRDVEAAAAIDGASRLATLRRVVLPMVAPGLAVAALFAWLYSWNEFLYARLLTTSQNTLPLQVFQAIDRGTRQQMAAVAIDPGAADPGRRGRPPAPSPPGCPGGGDPRMRGPYDARTRSPASADGSSSRLLAAVLAGACGRADEAERPALTFSASLAEDEKPAVRDVLERFRAESGIAVTLVAVTAEDLPEKLKVEVGAGRPTIDLFAQDNLALRPLVDGGLVQAARRRRRPGRGASGDGAARSSTGRATSCRSGPTCR